MAERLELDTPPLPIVTYNFTLLGSEVHCGFELAP